MKCNEVYEQIKELWADVEDNHSKYADKGNKSAGARARSGSNASLFENARACLQRGESSCKPTVML